MSAARRALGVIAFLVFAASGLAGDAPPMRNVRDAVRAALPAPDIDPFLGVVLDDHEETPTVAAVVGGSAAEAAGVVPGDELRSLDGVQLADAPDLTRVLKQRGVGTKVRLAVRRIGRDLVLTPTLGGRRRPDDCFRGAQFDLVVVPLRFADDVAPAPDAARLTRLLFAKSGVAGAGASLADYYRAQSFGRLEVTGRVLEPVTLPEPRAHYASQPMGGAPDSAFAAAADLLAARDASAVSGADGIAFLYAGEAETRPGFALWPHRSAVTVAGRRLPYYVHATSDRGADAIGVHCHEFGHLLGLPDAYGAAHLTGSGDFCLMAIGHRGGGSTGARAPFSMCAWCRMRLGWIEPVAVDPRTPQRLRLDAVSRAPDQALLVPLTPRTDEYLLLEVRRREGFDAELPSAGLLVWHVGGGAAPGRGAYGNYVELVAAHGIDCVDATMLRTSEIAFPTQRARDITPQTQPTVRASAGDGFAPFLTDIEALGDGSVALTLGVNSCVRQPLPKPEPVTAPDDEGFVVRTDPVTGAAVRLYVGTGEAPPMPLPAGTGERR
jgi:M6 family metalloprotease-like protein